MPDHIPDGFTSRPPLMDEVVAVTDLVNARHIFDIGMADESVERMRMFWEEDIRDLSRDNLVVFAPEGRLAAYADFGEWEPYDTCEFTFAVHPDFRDAGLEEPLFDWAEARARESVIKAAPDARVLLETGTWATSTFDAERLKRRGFQLQREWSRMQIDMDAPPPAPVWPPGISVRTLDLASEVEAVHQAWEDAQRDEWGFSSLTPEEWRYYLVDKEANFDPTLWFLAIDDAKGEIVGYVLGRLERPGYPESAQVRYVGVRRPYRRRGIARALLLHAFAEFWQRGKSKVGLAVDSISPTGADRLYAEVGMHEVQRAHIYEKVLRDAG
jgi:mycothiol synthase